MKNILHCLLFIVGFNSALSGQANCDAFSVQISAYSQTVYNRYDFSNSTGMPSPLTCNYFGLDSTDYIRVQIAQPYSVRPPDYCLKVWRIVKDGVVIDSVGRRGHYLLFFRTPGQYEIYFETYAPLTQRVIYLNITYDPPTVSGITNANTTSMNTYTNAEGKLVLDGMAEAGEYNIALSDALGRIVGSEQCMLDGSGTAYISNLEATLLPAGVYFCTAIHKETQKVFTGKFVN